MRTRRGTDGQERAALSRAGWVHLEILQLRPRTATGRVCCSSAPRRALRGSCTTRPACARKEVGPLLPRGYFAWRRAARNVSGACTAQARGRREAQLMPIATSVKPLPFLVRAPRPRAPGGLARTLSLTPCPLAPVIQSLVEPRARLGLANGGASERGWGWLRELVAERAGMGQTLLGWAALRKHVARPPPCPQNTVLPRPCGCALRSLPRPAVNRAATRG